MNRKQLLNVGYRKGLYDALAILKESATDLDFSEDNFYDGDAAALSRATSEYTNTNAVKYASLSDEDYWGELLNEITEIVAVMVFPNETQSNYCDGKDLIVLELASDKAKAISRSDYDPSKHVIMFTKEEILEASEEIIQEAVNMEDASVYDYEVLVEGMLSSLMIKKGGTWMGFWEQLQKSIPDNVSYNKPTPQRYVRPTNPDLYSMEEEDEEGTLIEQIIGTNYDEDDATHEPATVQVDDMLEPTDIESVPANDESETFEVNGFDIPAEVVTATGLDKAKLEDFASSNVFDMMGREEIIDFLSSCKYYETVEQYNEENDDFLTEEEVESGDLDGIITLSSYEGFVNCYELTTKKRA